MKDSAKTSTSGFLITLGSLAVGFGAYYADLQNLPVAAPIMDGLTGYLYAWLPILKSFPDSLWFAIGGMEVGACTFLIGTIVSACFAGPSTGESRAEIRLKKRARNPKAHRAGFNA
jgi:hypothetical protein